MIYSLGRWTTEKARSPRLLPCWTDLNTRKHKNYKAPTLPFASSRKHASRREAACGRLPRSPAQRGTSGRRWSCRTRTWAWPPPLLLPVPPPLLPPPLPCLCCCDPVISAILLSICSSRSRMDILNWLSRAEQGRVRLCSERSGVNLWPSPACRTDVWDGHRLNPIPGFVRLVATLTPHTRPYRYRSPSSQRKEQKTPVKVLVSGSGTPFLCQIAH